MLIDHSENTGDYGDGRTVTENRHGVLFSWGKETKKTHGTDLMTINYELSGDSVQAPPSIELPVISVNDRESEMDKVAKNAENAARFLKAISHEGRLMILCHLSTGEKSVTELEQLLSTRQAAVSQQLSRLRLENLVVPRRAGKAIYYRLADNRPQQIIDVVYDIFCRDEAA